MNYEYILNKIKGANEYAIDAYDYLNQYEISNNNKYLYICRESITEINELLTTLEIEIKLEVNENE